MNKDRDIQEVKKLSEQAHSFADKMTIKKKFKTKDGCEYARMFDGSIRRLTLKKGEVK